MYVISRLLFMLAVLILAGSLVAVLMKAGAWGIVLLVGLVGLAARKRVSLWAYGTARWANATDLYRRGMLK